MPYYEFREVLSVRDGDAPRFRSLADLRGKTVGTLGGTIAYEILLRAERETRPARRLVRRRRAPVQRSGDSDAWTPSCWTNVLAERRHRTVRGFTVQPGDRRHRPLRRRPGGAERSAPRQPQRDPSRRDARRGRSSAIFRKWAVWNERPSRSSTRGCWPANRYPQSSASTRRATSPPCRAGRRRTRYFPSLLRASVVTIVLSCLSMGLAVAIGVLIATGRVYGGALARAALTAYVEVIRGTADPVAALRALLRARRRGAAAGVRRGRSWAWR